MPPHDVVRTGNIELPPVHGEPRAGERRGDGRAVLLEGAVVVHAGQHVAEENVGVETGVPVLVETEGHCVYASRRRRVRT